jgi:hypothetical protein
VYTAVPPVFYALLGRDPNLLGMWTLASALSAAAYICFLLHSASVTQHEQMLHLQREADSLGTVLARAELAMLEAQIEPHFLFNTLAHVKRQYRKDAAAADRMLLALIEYLERALPALRKADWTVGDEIDLIEVYLNILAQRFGERLQFMIVAREADRAVRLPALTVATLVENAVRHGLAPKIEGGSVFVNVMRTDDNLSIDVCDNGVGLRHSSGSGLGLATVRARLRSAFGDQATLRVEPWQPHGVRAAITIPAAA